MYEILIILQVIYPLIEKCGIRMTALRRMSAGQIITALSFVVSGFVQMAIDDKITPIPDYGNEDRLYPCLIPSHIPV